MLDSSRRSPSPEEAESSSRKSLADQHLDDIANGKASKAKGKEAELNYAKRVDASEAVDLDRDRLRRALAEEKKRKQMGDDEAWQNTKKSKTDVTQEELEAYRLSRQNYDDPMANYKDPEDES